MDIDDAMEYMKVDELRDGHVCDYCNTIGEKSFIKFHEWEVDNTNMMSDSPLGTKVRSISTGNDWESSRGQEQVSEPSPVGKQHHIHYRCCDKCLLKYANRLYNSVSQFVGNPHMWFNTYMAEQVKIAQNHAKMGSIRVGTPVSQESSW